MENNDIEIFGKRIKRNHFIFGIVGVVVVVVVVIAAIVGISVAHTPKSEPVPVKEDCKADGFESMTYTFTDGHGKPQEKFLKYKFVEDTTKDEYYIFDEATKACKELKSTLWGIVDGKEEWDSVMEMAKSENKGSLWINGMVKGVCNGMNFQLKIDH